MASSETDIVNVGLILLGQPTLLRLDDDNDVARTAHALWPDVRDAVLSEHPWNRCTKILTLSKTPRNPAWVTTERSYSYEYLYPPDCLRILEPEDDLAKWEAGVSTTGEAVVWSDVDGLTVKYIFRNTNVSQYSAWLSLALSKRMAAEMALPLTQSLSKANAMMGAYQLHMSRAKGMDGQEQSPVVFTPTTLTDDVRLGG